MMDFHEDPAKFIERFSKEFENKFLEVFEQRFGYSNFVQINNVYNEYIKDAHHTHLNATKWSSISDFADYLADSNRCELKKEEINGQE